MGKANAKLNDVPTHPAASEVSTWCVVGVASASFVVSTVERIVSHGKTIYIRNVSASERKRTC